MTPGGGDHGALDIDKQAVGIGDAVLGDAATAHDRGVDVHFGEGLDGERADEHAEARVDHAAADEDFDVGYRTI